MIARLAALLLLVWVLGFPLFVVLLPGPSEAGKTDAIVVATGGPGRIPRGLKLLDDGQAKRMLITGVGRSVRPRELARANGVPLRLFTCCVDLGRDAVDTQSNGEETAAWVVARRFESVRLVTTDWHMPRARFELERALAGRATVVPDAIDSAPDLGVLLREYNKFLLRRIAVLVGL